MALRHRQESGIPLTKEQGFLFTVVGALCVWLLAKYFWFPLLGIPREFQTFLASIGVCLYIAGCTGNVPRGREQAQLFLGSYTGISFPAGIYCLPKIPFPVVYLVISIISKVFNKDVASHFGWILEGTVTIESIVVTFASEGMTSDGVRVSLSGSLIFEIENAATFLSQTEGISGRSEVHQAISALASARIKQRVIARHTVKQILQADYSAEYEQVNEWVTEACAMIEEFGLSLSQSPVVKVDILNAQIQSAVDMVNAKALLRESTDEIADAFAEFARKMPPGIEPEVVVSFFNTSRLNQGLPPININLLKLK